MTAFCAVHCAPVLAVPCGQLHTLAAHSALLFAKWYAPVQLAHLALPCTGHASPEVCTPFAQWHCFVAHWRSDVVVAAVTSYCPAKHAVCDAQSRSDVAVGATLWYCPAPHCVLSAHSRLLVPVGATVWCCWLPHCVFATHTPPERWYSPEHAEHISVPCAVHSVPSFRSPWLQWHTLGTQFVPSMWNPVVQVPAMQIAALLDVQLAPVAAVPCAQRHTFASQLIPLAARWKLALQPTHLLVPCPGHRAPCAAVPFPHVHCFVAQTLSRISDGAVTTYWCDKH